MGLNGLSSIKPKPPDLRGYTVASVQDAVDAARMPIMGGTGEGPLGGLPRLFRREYQRDQMSQFVSVLNKNGYAKDQQLTSAQKLCLTRELEVLAGYVPPASPVSAFYNLVVNSQNLELSGAVSKDAGKILQGLLFRRMREIPNEYWAEIASLWFRNTPCGALLFPHCRTDAYKNKFAEAASAMLLWDREPTGLRVTEARSLIGVLRDTIPHTYYNRDRSAKLMRDFLKICYNRLGNYSSSSFADIAQDISAMEKSGLRIVSTMGVSLRAPPFSKGRTDASDDDIDEEPEIDTSGVSPWRRGLREYIKDGKTSYDYDRDFANVKGSLLEIGSFVRAILRREDDDYLPDCADGRVDDLIRAFPSLYSLVEFDNSLPTGEAYQLRMRYARYFSFKQGWVAAAQEAIEKSGRGAKSRELPYPLLFANGRVSSGAAFMKPLGAWYLAQCPGLGCPEGPDRQVTSDFADVERALNVIQYLKNHKVLQDSSNGVSLRILCTPPDTASWAEYVNRVTHAVGLLRLRMPWLGSGDFSSFKDSRPMLLMSSEQRDEVKAGAVCLGAHFSSERPGLSLSGIPSDISPDELFLLVKVFSSAISGEGFDMRPFVFPSTGLMRMGVPYAYLGHSGAQEPGLIGCEVSDYIPGLDDDGCW